MASLYSNSSYQPHEGSHAAELAEMGYHMRFGAQLLDKGRTLFRLWAPSAEAVSLVVGEAGKASNELTMQRDTEAGWFSLEAECGAGTRYRYRVLNRHGQELMVPDPASRAQADGVHGDSIVVDTDTYQWQHPDWKGRPWHESVLYQLHVGAMGGFNGTRSKLARLADMGFTAIQLMPLASFPGTRNWGYDGVLPFAPHSSYGTPDELKALIDEAHGLGMMVFNDVVYNHFGPDGNYLNHYAEPFFREDIKTLWGAAIDFTQPEVRSFYSENVMYWLQEYKFDGLRFDACHAIADKSWLYEIAEKVKLQFGRLRHVHLVAENDGNTSSLLDGGIEALKDLPDSDSNTPEKFERPGKFSAQWNDDGHHVLHVLLTGETEGYYSYYADQPAEKLARCLAEGFIYQGEHLPGMPVRGEPSANLPPTAFVFFLQNHDQIGNRPFGERLTTLTDPQALRAANALVLLAPHIPMLFMGEEFGATQPFLYFTSHDNEALVTAISEGRRKEFSKFSKFSQPGFSIKIPEPNLESTFLDSIPDASGDGIASAVWEKWARNLLALRHKHIIPRLAGAHALAAIPIGPAAVTARWQMADNAILAIAINLSSQPVAASLEDIANIAGADVLFDSGNVLAALAGNSLPGYSFIAFMEPSS
jgi:maltooligosyltrehalose trehalohydrolase